jgi:adenosylhomocysteine nucleosidase
MPTIGLIAAMPQEIAPLLKRIDGYQHSRRGPFQTYRFQISDRDCLLIYSGMGMRRATAAARVLIEAAHPALIVSFGIAGGLDPELSVGDVILASSACRLENGVPVELRSLAELTAGVEQTLSRELQPRGARLFTGTTLTTSGSQAVQLRGMPLPHPVLEMETAGIARVSTEKGIPLFALRSISDSVAEPLPFDMAAFFDRDANLNYGKIIQAIAHRPRLLAQFRRLMANTTKAAENLAIVLLALLRQPLPGVS